MVAIEGHEAGFALLKGDGSGEFAVAHVACCVLCGRDARFGEFSCLPFNIYKEGAASTESLDAAFCPRFIVFTAVYAPSILRAILHLL